MVKWYGLLCCGIICVVSREEMTRRHTIRRRDAFVCSLFISFPNVQLDVPKITQLPLWVHEGRPRYSPVELVRTNDILSHNMARHNTRAYPQLSYKCIIYYYVSYSREKGVGLFLAVRSNKIPCTQLGGSYRTPRLLLYRFYCCAYYCCVLVVHHEL